MSKAKTIYLKDYTLPAYWIRKTELEIELCDDKAIVNSRLEVERNKEDTQIKDLVLDGVDLKLLDVKIDGEQFSDYEVNAEHLILRGIKRDKFILEIVVENYPDKNFSCEGLYRAGDFYCTQCEAEGFRKITYYLDRPDVMSMFTTKVIADKSKYPTLLCNGNPVAKGELDNGRHFVTWEDPHAKPSYLFAVVIGDLALVADYFTTRSGRKVALEIYVDKGNEDKCAHAMQSLKKSMRWDEERFDLEYDLDIYMIVATDSFNMGAMENKGLNIFNSAYVLARQDTATDMNFYNIEAVIGHEYFHNWTGNRVTCRDWFQLTLKEGLTVFRDQEFSSDLNSRAVKRIDDVKGLRAHQFVEDAGPMSHPIQPKSYIEINNFYTATVYEKGSEIIRMIHTLIGEENFQKGMKLYFERHDGQAVTTQDFVAAMSDAGGHDLTHFKVWYDQNGTPVLHISDSYDEVAKTFSLKIRQDVKTNNADYDCLYMPFNFALFHADGRQMQTAHAGQLILNAKEQEFVFTNITERPVLSCNRNYSSPVVVDYDYSDSQLAFLARYENDSFNRYDALQSIYLKDIIANANRGEHDRKISQSVLDAYKSILAEAKNDVAFSAYALSLPTLSELCEKVKTPDYDALYETLEMFRTKLAKHFYAELEELYVALENQNFSLDPESMGRRSLRNVCLMYLVATQEESAFNLAQKQFESASNMTDEMGALAALAQDLDVASTALQKFYTKWKNEKLVIQKWMGLIAQNTSAANLIERLKKIELDQVYDEKIPNFLRATVGAFAGGNPYRFNAIDGSGYKFVTERIAHIDSYNPQVAARLAKSFYHYKRLDSNRQSKAKIELERLLEKRLSNDTYEVVSSILKE